MARTTRTLNPLHFEDLEPHRFEDLVRQLAYSYKRWRSLEATGRLGKDQGLDIRGIEIVGPEHDHASDDDENGDSGGDSSELLIGDAREWRIQVKRLQASADARPREDVAQGQPQRLGSLDPRSGSILAVCWHGGREMACNLCRPHPRNHARASGDF